MIPITCAVINFFINRNMVTRKAEESNEFMLRNIQYNIDSKLANLLDLTKYCLLDSNFNIYRLSARDDKQFLERVRRCYETLDLVGRANPDVEMMMYLPEREYLVDTKTGNHIQHIYDSLVSQGKISVGIGEWKKQISKGYKNQFLITDELAYGNYGKTSLVYATPLLYSNSRVAGYIYCSTPAEFIDILLNNESQGTALLILDEQQQIIGTFGDAEGVDWSGLTLPDTPSRFSVKTDNGEYIASCVTSDVVGWTYVSCTPKSLYMADAVTNMGINLAVIIAGAVMGIAAITLVMRGNYRPVRRLVEVLPEGEEIGADEFQILEANLRRLFDENKSMQSSVKKKEEYEREMDLLWAMKGRERLFGKTDLKDLLGVEDPAQKRYAFVTVLMDYGKMNPDSAITMEYDLLEFIIDNVVGELFGDLCRYISVTDDAYRVFLFILDRDMPSGAWKENCQERFLQLNTFFETRLATGLSVTMGECFDSFENVGSAYAQMQEANEQRYYTDPTGVLWSSQIEQDNILSEGRLAYYRKRFKEAVLTADTGEAEKLSGQLFEELEHSGNPFPYSLYYIMSIVNDIVIECSDVLRGDGSWQNEQVKYLYQIRVSESLSAAKSAFYRFLRWICGTVGRENKDSANVSGAIRQYVLDHYNDCNMNISSIAGTMGLSSRYMSRLFKEQTGLNLLNYINDVRIEHAKLLLRETDKTIAEVAEETGFSNIRSFRRNFQKATGVTASYYKSDVKNGRN